MPLQIHEQADLEALADAIGERPETVIAVHLLRKSLCSSFILGKPSAPDAAIVQSNFCPTEPQGFGADPEDLWSLLKEIEGWDCIEVNQTIAPELSRIIERETGSETRLLQDIHHVPKGEVRSFRHEAVRLLTIDDAELLDRAEPDVRGSGFVDTRQLLREGIVAAAIIADRIEAIGFTTSRTAKYADIGVHTLPAFRRRGLARAAGSLVAREVQRADQIPVWSTGENNHASLNLARLLGFHAVGRLSYVIVDRAG